MNQPTTPYPDRHQQIQLLLPWYVNQSLQHDDRDQVENHIRHCLRCRRELVSICRLAKAITNASDLDTAAEVSFAGLKAKLPARSVGNTSLPSPAKMAIRDKLGRYASRTGIRYAMAASILLAMLPLGLQILPTQTGNVYYTLSAAKPEQANDRELRVVFAKSASAAEVAAALETIHGLRIGEANSAGALTIRLDTDRGSPEMKEALALLRNRPDVLLAEPVLQP